MSRSDSISKIHIQLLERRDALRKSLHGDWRLLRENHRSPAGDPIDAAGDAERDEVHGRLIEGENRELVAIDEALERYEEGKLGICEQCGRNIPVTRLRAVPYATDCIGCRRKTERSSTGIGLTWQSYYMVQDADAV